MELDSQVVEILGRQRLIAELLRAGLEVAMPLRDRGVDLIAYTELSEQVALFGSRPIQMKAATKSSFVIDMKFAKIANLILAFVWHLDDPSQEVTYALAYPDAIAIGDAMGWTATASWQQGKYTTTQPSKKLVDLLEPHRMTSARWWRLVTGLERPGGTTAAT